MELRFIRTVRQRRGGEWGRGLVLMGALLTAPRARAAASAAEITVASIPIPGSIYLSTGLLLSATGRPAGFAGGLGGELSVHGFLDTRPLSGVGLFGQWQSVNFDHQRICAGVQLTSTVLGIELGAAHETAGPKGSATTSVHIGPFLSMGLVTASFRFNLPVATGPGALPGYGPDLGVTLAIKLPLRLRVGEEHHEGGESSEPPPQAPVAQPPNRKRPPPPPPPPPSPSDAPLLTPRVEPRPTPSREPLDGPSS